MDETTAAKVDRLFARFSVLYGHRFTGPIDDDALWELARHEWAPAVQALTGEQIRQGIDACKASLHTWPPTFGEFVRLALGLPEPHQAAAMAAKGEKDTLSRLIRRETGDAYNVGRSEHAAARRMCERAYGDVVRRMVEQVNRGEAVDPAAQIEADISPAEQSTPRVENARARAGEPVSMGSLVDVQNPIGG